MNLAVFVLFSGNYQNAVGLNSILFKYVAIQMYILCGAGSDRKMELIVDHIYTPDIRITV